MKGLTKCAVLLGVAVGLSACATTGESSSYRSASASGVNAKFVTDTQYVAAVEDMASRSGVRVKWVNPPAKRIDND